MGILDRFERGLERAVNGAFAKTFRSGLQPVEIASALRRELDTNAAVVTRDRTVVPNRFAVRVAPADADRFRTLGDALVAELTDVVTQHAASQGYSFTAAVMITITPDPSLTKGMLAIDSDAVRGDQVRWGASVEVNGRRVPLTRSRTVVGRGGEADLPIDDAGASRRHLEILWDGTNAQARDLGSTNGSKVDGEKARVADLHDGSVITIGQTRLVFRLTAQSIGGEPARATGRR